MSKGWAKYSMKRAMTIYEKFPELSPQEMSKFFYQTESYILKDGKNPSLELTFFNGNGCMIERHVMPESEEIIYCVMSFKEEGKTLEFSGVHDVMMSREYDTVAKFGGDILDSIETCRDYGTENTFSKNTRLISGEDMIPVEFEANELATFAELKCTNVLAVSNGAIDVESSTINESESGLLVIFDNGRGLQFTYDCDEVGYIASDIKVESFVVSEDFGYLKTPDILESFETESMQELERAINKVSGMEAADESEIQQAEDVRINMLEDSYAFEM